MDCRFHWDNKLEGFINYTALISRVTHYIEKNLKMNVELFDFSMKNGSGKIVGKTVKIRSNCAGCVVMHLLQAIGFIRVESSRKNYNSEKEFHNAVIEKARKFAEEMKLPLGDEHWEDWKKFLKGSQR